MSLLIHVHPEEETPLFRQIIDEIIGLIEQEALKPGAKLPSSRALADRIGVNRSTVYKAYQELWALGYIESRPGSYSTVRQRTKVAPGMKIEASGLIDWDAASAAGPRALFARFRDERNGRGNRKNADIIDFTPLSPDSCMFPLDDFRKCLNQVLVNEGRSLLQYGDPLGYRPLREFIAERMQQHSVSVSPEEILITGGAQNGIELVIQLLTGQGRPVAVEEPTYSRAIDLISMHNIPVVPIPMDQEGMDLDMLEAAAEGEKPALIYTIPNFHNPTGITTGQGHRERLLKICETYKIPLVEDGFEEEMKYFGKAVLPVKSMDRSGVVIYLGTFSKVLFPGLRIGWIAADRRCIERLLPIQRSTVLAGNQLDQAALHRFCCQGFYDLHIKRMHSMYRKRMNTALKAMRANLPRETAEWIQPAGGYTIWISVKSLNGTIVKEKQLLSLLTENGVRVTPGHYHYSGASRGVHFRLSIAHLEERQIEEGFRRIGAALGKLP